MDNNKTQNKKILKEINDISKKIQEKTDIQSLLIQYKKYNNNIHIPIGVISLCTITFISSRVINLDIANSIMLGLLGSSSLSLGTKVFFKTQKEKIKEKHPKIDFENSNIDDNYKSIEKLFNKKFKLTEELEKINKKAETKEDTKRHQDEIVKMLKGIDAYNEEVQEKTKVKTLKRM